MSCSLTCTFKFGTIIFIAIIYTLNTADDIELCVLCENPADVKFEPCGHVTMCSDCADRAKRCPVCKVQAPLTAFKLWCLDLSAISVLATGISLVLNLEDSFLPQKEEGSGLKTNMYLSCKSNNIVTSINERQGTIGPR